MKKMDKFNGIICLIVGFAPYIFLIILLILKAINGTSDCLIDLGPETNCHTIYGFKAIGQSLIILWIACYYWWYISLPVFVLSVLTIVKGIKYLNKGKNNN